MPAVCLTAELAIIFWAWQTYWSAILKCILILLICNNKVQLKCSTY